MKNIYTSLNKTHIEIPKLFATAGLFIPKQTGSKAQIKNNYGTKTIYLNNVISKNNTYIQQKSLKNIEIVGEALNLTDEAIYFAILRVYKYFKNNSINFLKLEIPFSQLCELSGLWISEKNKKRTHLKIIKSLKKLKAVSINTVNFDEEHEGSALIDGFETIDDKVVIHLNKYIDFLIEDSKFKRPLNLTEYNNIKNEYSKVIYKVLLMNKDFNYFDMSIIKTAFNINEDRFNEDKFYRNALIKKITKGFEELKEAKLIEGFGIKRKSQKVLGFEVVSLIKTSKSIVKEVKEKTELKEENSLLNILKEQNINIDTLKIDNKKIKRENRLLKDIDIFEDDIFEDD